MSELKRCPFCPDGGDVRMLSYFCETEYVAYAHCRKCGAYGPRITESLPLEEVKAEAIEAWNTRSYESCAGCYSVYTDWCDNCARAYRDHYVPKGANDER